MGTADVEKWITFKSSDSTKKIYMILWKKKKSQRKHNYEESSLGKFFSLQTFTSKLCVSLLLSSFRFLTLSDNYRTWEAPGTLAGVNWCDAGKADWAAESQPLREKAITGWHCRGYLYRRELRESSIPCHQGEILEVTGPGPEALTLEPWVQARWGKAGEPTESAASQLLMSAPEA